MISAILLAAGESRRMGTQNKLLLPYGGQELIRHMVQQLLQTQIAELILVSGHEADQVEAAVRDLGIQIVHNPRYKLGMTTSIQAGIAAASEKSTGFMVCLSDMPRILPEEYDGLMDAFLSQQKKDDRTILIPVAHQQDGNPVIFSSRYRQLILDHPEMKGCKGVVWAHAAHVCSLPVDSAHFLRDMDTPEDYLNITTD